MAQQDRLSRLARQIETSAQQDEHLTLKASEIAALRRQAACAIHSVCADFVGSVNRLLPASAVLELAPPEYPEALFRDTGINLIQINARGRVVQVAFQATEQLVSTRKYKIPYILEGEVRAYNQQMLEHTEIEDYLLYFCMEKDRNLWRVFDWRTNHSGPFDRELLVSLMERLI
jgi:hypothetical protein